MTHCHVWLWRHSSHCRNSQVSKRREDCWYFFCMTYFYKSFNHLKVIDLCWLYLSTRPNKTSVRKLTRRRACVSASWSATRTATKEGSGLRPILELSISKLNVINAQCHLKNVRKMSWFDNHFSVLRSFFPVLSLTHSTPSRSHRQNKNKALVHGG